MIPSSEPGSPLEDDRYARLRLIPWWSQEILRKATVAVVGVGAVGNEVVKNLALMGIGRLILLDKDTIELTNLTRSVLFRREDVGQPKTVVAARRARELDPSVETIALTGDLADLGVAALAGADVIIGCVDSLYGRILLNRYAAWLGVPWINGGLGDATDVFKGIVAVFHPPEGPCFECGLRPGQAEQELTARLSRGGCGETERKAQEARSVPSTPTMASIIGALQVQEALKILHAGLHPDDPDQVWPEPALGAFVAYETCDHTVNRFQRKVRQDCPNHVPGGLRQVEGFDRDRPLGDLWAIADLEPDTWIGLARGTWIEPWTCEACDHATIDWCWSPGPEVTCPACGTSPRPPGSSWAVGPDHPVTVRSLAELGVPGGLPLRQLTEPEITLWWPTIAQEAARG